MFKEIEKCIGEDIKLEVTLHNKWDKKLTVDVSASIIPHGGEAACFSTGLSGVPLDPCTEKTVELTLRTGGCSEGDHDLYIAVYDSDTHELLGEELYERVIKLKTVPKEVEIVDYELD